MAAVLTIGNFEFLGSDTPFVIHSVKRVEVYDTYEQAESAGEQVTANEGFDYFVSMTPSLEDKSKAINLTWTIWDVQYADSKVSEKEALQVLYYIQQKHDPAVGVSWDTISMAICWLRELGLISK